MILLLLATAAVALWGLRSGEVKALRMGDVAAVLAALIGASLLRHGNEAPALLAFAGAGLWAWHRRRKTTPAAAPLEIEDARRILEVPPDADADAIRAAHRRLIALVHPDAGGSAELARRVNAARDLLLAARADELPSSPGVPRPS